MNAKWALNKFSVSSWKKSASKKTLRKTSAVESVMGVSNGVEVGFSLQVIYLFADIFS